MRGWLPIIFATLVASAACAAPASAATTSSNSTPITFPTNGPTAASTYPSNITVAGVGTPATVSARLVNVNHAYPRALDVLLVGPTGARSLLVSDMSAPPTTPSA